MGDDSIGIKVLDELSPQLNNEKIEVIFGETDVEYSLNKIEEGDFIFIIDSTYFNIKPGTVTFTPFEEVIAQHQQVYSQHQPSLINLLKIYRKSVDGFVIGIEVEEVNFCFELSDTLKVRLPHICEEVYKFIKDVIRGDYHA